MSKRLYLLVIFFMLAFFKGQSIRKEDKYTGEIFSYSPVTLWEDGTTMIDSKIDGVIYVKESNKYYRRNYPQVLNASWFGIKSNDGKDDSDALQTAISYAVKTKQGLVIPFGRYNVSKTILIPQMFTYSMKNLNINFSNSTVIMDKDVTLFQSDNWGTKLDSNYTNGLCIENLEIISNIGNLDSYAFKLQDYHQATKLQNISTLYNKNFLYSKNSYYLELYNVNTNLSTSKGNEGKRFLFEGYHGANKFSKLTAINSEVGYSFEGGMTAAIEMSNISFEGCRVCLYSSSEVYNLVVKSSYFENFDLAMKFDNYIHSASIENNYINFLNKSTSSLIQYKGLPLNNIYFNSGNTYIGTDFSNFIRNKENVYGAGVKFEINNPGLEKFNNLKNNLGANNKIILNN